MWGRQVLLIFFALVALGTTKCPRRKTSPIREILCYTFTSDVRLLAGSVCSCTTLVHQNYDVRNLSTSGISDLRKSLKEMHPSLQFVISIYDPAMTLRSSAMVRQEAIARIITVMKEVDGVEMNVTAGSKERLYNFVKSLKDEMIRKSYDKRIFMALPNRPEDLAKQFDIKELVKYVDLFTLSTDYMTDEDGSFVTFHPSRLMGLFDMLNSDSLVDLISGLGAPKQKILMTLPANAYKFTLKNEDDNAPRSETTEKEPLPIDRKQLCEAVNSGEWTVERDEDLTAPYAFQNRTWIAFEDKISIGIKVKYALLRDLAGLAMRNIENDVETECEEPLAREIYQSFTEFRRKSRQAVLNALEDELHQMQFSYPNHAKTSDFRVVRAVDAEGHIRAVRENTQTEFVCRRQGYFVHPKSCNRFYRCVKFNQAIEDYSVFEFDCPAGLSFDESTEVCVWPGSLPEGSPCPGSSEIAPIAPKRFKCSQPGYYADPQNCRWFFACMDLGESELMAFEFRCPYGLVFDEKKLVCEWPWLVPACSESGSGYARTEYNYGGYTAGASTGGGIGGYVTGGLPEYSIRAETDYSNVDYSKTTGAGIHETNYFGSTAGNINGHTGISISGVGTVSGSIGGDYSKSTQYADAASFGQTGPSFGSVSYHGGIGNIEIAGSTTPTYGKSTGSEYSQTTSGISSTESNINLSTNSGVESNLYSTTSSSHIPGTDFVNGFSKSTLGTSKISTVSGHVNVTPRPTGASSTGYRYEDGGYTIPVFVQHEEPSIYSSIGTTGSGVKGYVSTGTTGTEFTGYGKTDFTRPNLNISVFGNEIPTRYDVQKGTTGAAHTGSSVNRNSITSNSYSENVFNYGNVPERVSTPDFNQGTVPTGGVQPGYIATSSGTPNGPGISLYGTPSPGILVNGPSTAGVLFKGESTPNVAFSGPSVPRVSLGSSIPPSSTFETSSYKTYESDSTYHGISTPVTDSTVYSSTTPSKGLISGGRIDGTGSSIFGSTFQGSTTVSPEYSSRPAVFTPSGFTKTGPTKTGITTAVLGGGGSYSVSTTDRRPSYNPDNISEKAFEGNVAGYTKTSSTDGLSVTLIPPGYSSTAAPGSVSIQQDTSGYSYFKPTGQFGTNGPAFSSTTASGGRVSIQSETPGYSYPNPTVQFGTSGPTFSSTTAPGGRVSIQSETPSYSYPNPTVQFGTSGPAFSSTTAPGGRVSIQSETPSYSYPNPTVQFGTSGPAFSSTTAPGGRVSIQSETPSYSYPNPTVQFGTSGPAFSSTTAPGGRVSIQSETFGYSYPKPTVQFGKSGPAFSSATPITPIENNLSVTTSTPFFNRIPTSTVAPVIYTTEHPEIYKTALFESKKISGTESTIRPIDNGYKTFISSTTPASVYTDDRFIQQTGGSQATYTSSFDQMSFQHSDSSSQTGSSLGYLPAKSTQPDVTTSTVNYDVSTITARPEIGITYKKPSSVPGVSYGGSSSFESPTTYRPSNVYYSTQGFSTTSSSLETTPRGGSPTNLDISRDKIDKLITNYDRGTVKYTPTTYDTFASSGYGSSRKFTSSLSSTKSSFGTRQPTLSYEVTTKSSEGKGKVIIKWSDLHPLLLGKLGAECTCKADPFANIRGPARKLIESSKGKVDLANYDSSEIYVDLGDDSSERNDYSANYDNIPVQPFKISKPKLPTSANLPSSSYLPTIDVRISGKSNELHSSTRTGKKLEYEKEEEEEGKYDEGKYDEGKYDEGKYDEEKYDEGKYDEGKYEEEYDDDDPDQIINGVTDCARPGLFRHPSLCNKFYACHWDQWKKKFTLHIFNCPVHLTFDTKEGACNWPSKGPACQANNLLV
ncbi:hypothetical protein PUN28_019120 [Cardiocondyla obscurior]|uniref:Chitin-binding type-2 domain-containing protein n=1 Tax=Cardiocondyla obscurior TaxID=286306 RepID=A0AAW2EG84_9HYME